METDCTRLRLRQILRPVPPEDLALDESVSSKEMLRRVRAFFKRLDSEMALVAFAKAMTSTLPSRIKAMVWMVVRYSHIWWGVDELLKGDVLDHPIVRVAFADTIAMRSHRAERNDKEGEIARLTIGRLGPSECRMIPPALALAIDRLVHDKDGDFQEGLQSLSYDAIGEIVEFKDSHGKNLLWYLTYRDDQQAIGGFAAPLNEAALLSLGVDPLECNDLGLCWNDVREHVNRAVS